MTRLAIFIATAGYTGYAPIAPGTVGSIVGLAVYAAVRWVGSPVAEIGAILLTLGLGVWSGHVAERFFGGIDPGPVVIDEVLGMLVTLAFIPVGWPAALAGFVVFRVFDVIKPFPAGRLEALPGGWGVMFDDAMAAIYSNLLLRLIIWTAPAWFK